VTGRESLTARGRLHLLGPEFVGKRGANFKDIFASCLLCGACEEACSRDIPIRSIVVGARSSFPAVYGRHGMRKAAVRLALSRPGLLEGLAAAGVQLKNLALLPQDSGLRLKLGILEEGKTAAVMDVPSSPEPGGVKSAPILYFTGCLARHLQPSVAEATRRLCRDLSAGEARAPAAQACCGLAAWSSGSLAQARRLARKNIEAFAGHDGPILTSCASCSSFLQTYPDLFGEDPEWKQRAADFASRVREFGSFFLPRAGDMTFRGGTQLRLFYHEPCHLRADRVNREACRQLLDKISAATLLDSPGGSHCCGQGGLFHIGYPGLAEKVFSRAFAALPDSGSGNVVTTCSGCLMQWQAGLARHGSPYTARHLALLLADCLG
jgi:glycolate oxidase iron-sulfur subunit